MGRIIRLIGFCWRRREFERNLAEELELHRDLTQKRLEQSGLGADDSARASRRAMGNVTLAREVARHVWLAPSLEGVWQDAAYAVRTIRRIT
jgi:hypothetical protein